MERIRQRYAEHSNFIPFLLITACISAVFCGLLLKHADFRFLSNIKVYHFETVDTTVTSTDYRYETGFEATLLQYETLNEMIDVEQSFAIPGLTNTNVIGKVTDQMVPQGICAAGDYILISAYNYDGRFYGGIFRREILNSVIYIMSKDGEYLNTLVLPDVSHVGGLAFDGKNIWIGNGAEKTVSVFPYQVIADAAEAKGDSYLLPEFDAQINCDRAASFVEYYDGLLWIGTFCSDASGDSEVGAYKVVDWENQTYLYQITSLGLPSNAQGISFYETENGTCMAVSASHGRYRDSVIYLYQMTGENRDISIDYQGECTLPPMSEEMYNDGEQSYIVFESAATCYSTNQYNHCIYPVDRICVIENEKLLAEMQ